MRLAPAQLLHNVSMHLNPRQLEAFRRVMVTGSMTVAAEFLNISQPAVSRLIKDLEESLSIRLFRREGNRLIPSPEARTLFREVDLYYQGMERIEKVAQDLKSSRVGTLRIACMTVLGLSLLCEAIRIFSLARPGLIASLDVRNSLSVLELAANNQIDVGFVHGMATEYPGVEIFPLPSVKPFCVLPLGHKLAGKTAVEITDLQGESLIALSPNNPMRLRLDMALDAAGVSCSRSIETTLAYSACCLVAGNMGIAVVDAFTATQFKNSSVVCLPFTPNIPFEYAMVLPAHQARSKILQEFIKTVKELLDSMNLST